MTPAERAAGEPVVLARAARRRSRRRSARRPRAARIARRPRRRRGHAREARARFDAEVKASPAPSLDLAARATGRRRPARRARELVALASLARVPRGSERVPRARPCCRGLSWSPPRPRWPSGRLFAGCARGLFRRRSTRTDRAVRQAPNPVRSGISLILRHDAPHARGGADARSSAARRGGRRGQRPRRRRRAVGRRRDGQHAPARRPRALAEAWKRGGWLEASTAASRRTNTRIRGVPRRASLRPRQRGGLRARVVGGESPHPCEPARRRRRRARGCRRRLVKLALDRAAAQRQDRCRRSGSPRSACCTSSWCRRRWSARSARSPPTRSRWSSPRLPTTRPRRRASRRASEESEPAGGGRSADGQRGRGRRAGDARARAGRAAALPGAGPATTLVGLGVEAIKAVDPVTYARRGARRLPAHGRAGGAAREEPHRLRGGAQGAARAGSKVAPPPTEEEGASKVLRAGPRRGGAPRCGGRGVPATRARSASRAARSTTLEYALPPAEEEPGGDEGGFTSAARPTWRRRCPRRSSRNAEGEAALEEWYASLDVLSGGGPRARSKTPVASAIGAAVEAALALKAERLAAKKAYDEETSGSWRNLSAEERARRHAAQAEASRARRGRGAKEGPSRSSRRPRSTR